MSKLLGRRMLLAVVVTGVFFVPMMVRKVNAQSIPPDSDRAKLQSLLKGRDPNIVDHRALGEAKRKMVFGAHARHLAKNVTSPPRDIRNVPTPQVQSGIMEGVEGPWSSSVFKTENAWQGYVDGQSVGIYAGARTADNQHGVIVVIAEPMGVEFYPIPTVTGPLKIMSESNGVLSLKSMQGVSYHFDLKQRVFLP